MTKDGRQGAYGRPRQKVMINAGRGLHNLASRQDKTSRDTSPSGDARIFRDANDIRDVKGLARY